MGCFPPPSKEQVRRYLQRRFGSNSPLPTLIEIRNELGWVERPVAAKDSDRNADVAERADSTA